MEDASAAACLSSSPKKRDYYVKMTLSYEYLRIIEFNPHHNPILLCLANCTTTAAEEMLLMIMHVKDITYLSFLSASVALTHRHMSSWVVCYINCISEFRLKVKMLIFSKVNLNFMKIYPTPT